MKEELKRIADLLLQVHGAFIQLLSVNSAGQPASDKAAEVVAADDNEATLLATAVYAAETLPDEDAATESVEAAEESGVADEDAAASDAPVDSAPVAGRSGRKKNKTPAATRSGREREVTAWLEHYLASGPMPIAQLRKDFRDSGMGERIRLTAYEAAGIVRIVDDHVAWRGGDNA